MGNGRLKKGLEDFSYKLPAVPGFIQGVPSACDLPGGSGLPTHTHPAHRLGVSHSHKVTESAERAGLACEGPRVWQTWVRRSRD